jgi:hypothetical protein
MINMLNVSDQTELAFVAAQKRCVAGPQASVLNVDD